MDRYEKILSLTIHEIMTLMDNPEELKRIAQFFAAGGYSREPDETLDAMYDIVFANIEQEN
jgi:hypothetical protein